MSAATAATAPTPISDRFTVVPKARDVWAALQAARARARDEGLPEEELPTLPDAAMRTYAALADYANNTTGLCWPEMETLAWILARSPRTIQRHIHQLEEVGLVEIVERLRRPDGTFRGYKYRLPHIARAAERIQERKKANKEAYEERKRKQREANDQKRKRRLAHRSERDASRSKPAPNNAGEDPNRRRTAAELKRGHEHLFGDPPISGEEGDRRRREGYEWLFDKPPEPTPPAPTPDEQSPRREQEDHARVLDEAPPPNLPETAEPLPASTGHSCPPAPINGLTSTDNHIPPNPPEGAANNHREETMDQTAEPATRRAETRAGGDSPAEGAWRRVRDALLDAHPDLDGRELAVRSLSLSGTTLVVVLRATPIMSYADPLNIRQIGTTADNVRSRHHDELSRLWRELSGDPDAILELPKAP